jgi:RNA-directed DNA polymerase
MLLQRRLATLLQNCTDEINQKSHFKDSLSHGFKRGRSIFDNAKSHRRKRYVFNIDLENFFPSINFGRVRGFFIKDKNFMLASSAATVVAQIACHDNSLPQGSPCSPIISNLVGHLLDLRLSTLAYRTGCTYSRYADDITFSTNRRDFPSQIAASESQETHAWKVGEKLAGTVREAGFTINSAKTRMQYRNSRQDVTGLVVNKKVNIRSEYRRNARAMAHRLFATGEFFTMKLLPNQNGIVVPTEVKGSLAQLHGIFSHIQFVDRSDACLHRKSRECLNPTIHSGTTTKENLYRRFLLFKEFYAADKPVLICEGKTDGVYIRGAIRSSAAGYPNLAKAEEGGAVSLKIRIFKCSEEGTSRIVGLDGGTGPLQRFIEEYTRTMKSFAAPGKSHPVILLIDNDGGSSSVYEAVKRITKTKPTGDETFVHVAGNLYLVATPFHEHGRQSTIEDFFTKQTKQASDAASGGKQFNPGKPFDPTKHYGKHVFSQFVSKHADKIDFGGFAPILNRLANVISEHRDAYAKAEAQITTVS